MPKAGFADVTIVLDRSGSMSSIREDVVGGLNAFLQDQRSVDGDCKLTLVQFDGQDPYEVLYDNISVREAKDLSMHQYNPRASTPLHDAVGRAIVNTEQRIAKLPEDEQPEKVIFAIITDGFENASTKYNKDRIFEMIKDKTDNANWQFTFLAANQDAIQEGGNLGVAVAACADYAHTSGGITKALTSMSANVTEYRLNRSTGVEYSDQQREGMLKS